MQLRTKYGVVILVCECCSGQTQSLISEFQKKCLCFPSGHIKGSLNPTCYHQHVLTD